MDSRERVLKSLEHKEPDKVPFDFNGTNSTGIAITAYRRLLNYLSTPVKEISVFDDVQELAWVEEPVLKMLKVDTRGVSWPRHSQVGQERGYEFTDEWGLTWRKPNGGYYYDVVKYPLGGPLTKEMTEKYPWPTLSSLVNIEGLKKRAEYFHKQGKYAVVVNAPMGFFTFAAWLRGFEDFYSDLASNPSRACALMDKLIEIKMELWDLVLGEIRSYVDIVREGDDLGEQNSLLISPLMYRKYIKPRQKKLYSFIKEKAGSSVYLMLHSCGSVRDLIPDFIEVGVDILNPVQVSAAKMDTRDLKKEFGKEITFWGGGVDTQRILPYGSPQQVRDEVKKRIDELAPGGGFIFATVHNIQADVPPENIMAMWETLQEYGKY